jgi:hypothetical protein
MSDYTGFIANRGDATNLPTVRNLSDVAQADALAEASPDEVAEELERAALLRAEAQRNLRAQILEDGREAAFRIAVRKLPLTPEEISAAVPRLFAPHTQATPEEESTEESPRSL